ncbi:MAG: OprO/OprP family phosphate-selective porin [Kiritimatiellales bacterium]|nr:OprO/OprP family phosphate-selective porin [Kiritimatiellales bacterium]
MNKKAIYSIATGLAASVLTAFAADTTAEPSVYDKIWSNTELVNNKDATVLQKLSIVGRLQGDTVYFNSEDSGEFQDDVWRRFRMGGKAKLFNDFLIHAEMDLNLNKADSGSWDEFYVRLTDAYLGWEPSKAVDLKLGKQSAPFTLDGGTSSTKLYTPERSIVANNLWFSTEYFTGVGASGKAEEWDWRAGGYSASGEAEFGHFESGYFGLLSGGHKVGKDGSLRLDYVYNNPDYTGVQKDSSYIVGSRKLKHIASLVYKQKVSEKFEIWSDLSGATGINTQGNLFGIEIMPMYNISKTLQLVAQYAGVTDLEGNSDVIMSTYAQKNAGKKGTVETSHNMLLGFNWFLYGHKLKWQNAVEYNYGQNMANSGKDYNGFGLTSALRVSW